MRPGLVKIGPVSPAQAAFDKALAEWMAADQTPPIYMSEVGESLIGAFDEYITVPDHVMELKR